MSLLLTVGLSVGCFHLGLCGEMPHRVGSRPYTAHFGGVYTAELAPLGTGFTDSLVIAGPTVGSTNVLDSMGAGEGVVRLCLPHSE